ncbi:MULTISPECIES: hypothetical protein [unclassified Pseudomonas]|uniref:hypothetical protein n=1 Tax=unclassified Pseudomonas TaxID=196821 RepID=UPI00131B3ADE|nr:MULTISPECIES: hypothetical protein [unclassified Pseudomonas]
MNIASVTTGITEGIQLIKALASLRDTVRDLLGLDEGESAVEAINKLTAQAAEAAAAVTATTSTAHKA